MKSNKKSSKKKSNKKSDKKRDNKPQNKSQQKKTGKGKDKSKSNKKDSRPKIRKAALQLFNDNGVEKTTIKKLASEAKVSYGHLRHLYKTKEHLIIELQEELLEKIQKASPNPKQKPNLKQLYDYVHETFSLLLEYKFLMIDLVALVRKGELLSNGFNQLAQIRMPTIIQLFDRLTQKGYFRTDFSPDHHQRLLQQFIAFSNFWVSESEVFYTGRPNEKVDYYTRLGFDLFFPYFSNKGIQEYKELFKGNWLGRGRLEQF